MSESTAEEQEKTNEIFAIEIDRVTRLHLEYIIFKVSYDFYKNHVFTDQRIKPILDLLLQIVGVKMLIKDSEGLYETGFFSKGSKKLLSESMKLLLT